MRKLTALGIWIVWLLALSPALGQRLVFQKGDTLYSATEEGKEARTLFNLPAGTLLWAISPDGRRIVWMARPENTPLSEADLSKKPVTVYLADLTGRRQKRLFTTASLNDRLGRRVNRIGVTPADLPKWLSNPADIARDLQGFEEWYPYSLSWSADSRTLYLGCYRYSPVFGLISAALTVDANSGTAFVDADGRWRSLAPLLEVEAQGLYVLGVTYPVLKTQPEKYPNHISLYGLNLQEGVRSALFSVGESSAAPPYAFAKQPALAPENRAIAFSTANGKGLWVTDKYGKEFRQVAEGVVLRPRWTTNGKAIYFLLPRPTSTETDNAAPIYDLYAVPATSNTDSMLPPPPTLVLQGITWFDIVPY
jgi:hypothetical protein